MHTLYLSFYQIDLILKTNSIEIFDKLKNDFSFFQTKEFSRKPYVEIDIFLQDIPKNSIPALKASSQSLNSITYDLGTIRYNDYYGEALSIYNYETNKAELFSLNLDRLHEISYLLILSRMGEALDLKGLHKIHACAVAYKKCAFIVMMPMKGGKSTLFLNLLRQAEFEIISDDTPLIDRHGNVMAFPLRLGINQLPSDFSFDPNFISKIKREQYGDKYLVSLKAFKNSVASSCSRVVLLNGIRYSKTTTQINKCSKLSMIRPLLVHMVVGLGLPIILEYFLRFSWKEVIPKGRILVSRLISAAMLTLKGETYVLELGNDQVAAAESVIKFIKSKVD